MHKSSTKILNKILSVLMVINIVMPVTSTPLNRVFADNNFFQPKEITSSQLVEINKEKDLFNKKKSSLTGGKRKISSDLLKLVDDSFLTKCKTRKQLKDEMRANKQYSVANDNGEIVYVYINLKSGANIHAVDSYIQDATNRDAKNGIIVAWVDINNLQSLAGDSNVNSVRTVTRPHINKGSVTTDGVVALNVNKVLSKFQQSGSGMKIGVISNGVDNISSSVASGDLPSNVTVLSNTVSGNEGVAMLEIIYDMAPSAKLYFHDCGANVLGFNSAIDDLIAAGCNIIVDDIGWKEEPFFEDGVVAQHVTDVLNRNSIVYVSSAGNSADSHYQGMYEENSTDSYHKYPLYVSIPPGGSVDIILEWDDKFGETYNDYDLFLMDVSTKLYIDESGKYQTGFGCNPLERIYYTNDTSNTITGKIIADNYNGMAQAKTLEMYIYTYDGGRLYSNNLTSADSVYGQAAVPGALAVGAVDFLTNFSIRYYSSLGPSTIAYPSASTRMKPDICGVDGVATAAGGYFNPFYGTSAAAPHVAAIAALLWAEFPQKTGNQIRDLLRANANDLGSIGFDTTYGYGLSDAMKLFMATMSDHCLAADVKTKGNLPVVINSSGDTTNEIWLAPNDTTTFAEGNTMTKAAGDSTSINAPSLSGTYKLYLVVDGIASAPSSATLTVENPIQIDKLYLSDINDSLQSNLYAGKTVYISSSVSGPAVGTKLIFSVYNINKLISTSILNYTGIATYKIKYILPPIFTSLSCKVFAINDFGSLQPLTVKKELPFNTY